MKELRTYCTSSCSACTCDSWCVWKGLDRRTSWHRIRSWFPHRSPLRERGQSSLHEAVHRESPRQELDTKIHVGVSSHPRWPSWELFLEGCHTLHKEKGMGKIRMIKWSTLILQVIQTYFSIGRSLNSRGSRENSVTHCWSVLLRLSDHVNKLITMCILSKQHVYVRYTVCITTAPSEGPSYTYLFRSGHPPESKHELWSSRLFLVEISLC